MLPDADWFPWEEVVEVDRGFGTVCWVWTRPLPPTGRTVSIRRQAKRLFQQFVGGRDKGQVWMHLCERYAEPNMCVRPDHVVIGTKSSNKAHWHALRAAAGVSAHTQQATAAWTGCHHTSATRTKMSAVRRERHGSTP